MKLKTKNYSKFNSFQTLMNEHPNNINIVAGAWELFSLYMKYMIFLSKRRKNTNEIYFHTFYPPWNGSRRQAHDVKGDKERYF